MSKINRLNIISYATFQATIVAGLGLVLGVVYTFGGLILDILVTLDWVPPTETPGLSLGTLLAFGGVVGMPLVFMAAGFVLGIIQALLYNLFAKWFGGLSLKFK